MDCLKTQQKHGCIWVAVLQQKRNSIVDECRGGKWKLCSNYASKAGLQETFVCTDVTWRNHELSIPQGTKKCREQNCPSKSCICVCSLYLEQNIQHLDFSGGFPRRYEVDGVSASRCFRGRSYPSRQAPMQKNSCKHILWTNYRRIHQAELGSMSFLACATCKHTFQHMQSVYIYTHVCMSDMSYIIPVEIHIQ